MQKRFKRALDLKKARMKLLNKYWIDVQQKMIIAMVKAKKDGKKLQRIQTLSVDMREAVLNRYFNKCSRKYAAAFFEWRKKRRRLRVKSSVELTCKLRAKVSYIDDATREKLMHYGIDGVAEIEEKRLKFEGYPQIEKLSEIEMRGVIRTTFEEEPLYRDIKEQQ